MAEANTETGTKKGWNIMKTASILVLAIGISGPAFAQQVDLSAMPVDALRPEVQRRYDESLAATKSPAVLASTSSSFTWASEAKVQCGIALGFLKSTIRDNSSLSKCERFHRLINQVPPPTNGPAPLPEQPIIPNRACESPLNSLLFFDWNSAMAPANTAETISFIIENRALCNWTRINVTGHTDRSGSNTYNQNLSQSRADEIASKMRAAGIDGNDLVITGRGETTPKVDTPDGERNPTNRRVEITAN